MKVGFIGGGQMCEAIASGLVKQSRFDYIIISEPFEPRRAYLKQKFPKVEITNSNSDVISRSDVVVIAVKPQQLEDAFRGIMIKTNPLFISICAGVTLDKLQHSISSAARIARVMPNFPAMIGAGACGFCLNAKCSDSDSVCVESVFTSVGAVVEKVSENLIDVVTGVSGSGPAYVCMFIEALADAGVKHGLSRETALRLAAQTCVGTGQLVLGGGDSNHPAVIKDKVCSPGGTSIAAVVALEQSGFRAAVFSGVTAAVDRSRDLELMISQSPQHPSLGSATHRPLIVVKVGTSTLMKVTSTGEQRVNLANMGALVDSVTSLHREGYGVIIVTSAAVGFGCLKLKLSERPKNLALKQAVAAAGQSQLIRMYEDLFGVYGVNVAQILLSRFDFSAKDRFANVHNAIRALLDLRVIPIINENDTVSTEELRFGDNDTLSALVSVGVSADRLFLLTDVDCLYTANPRTMPTATPVIDVSASELTTIGGADSGGSGWGTGGMITKIVAARTAVCAGIEVVLSHGAFPERVLEYMQSTTDMAQKRPVCTVFHAAEKAEESTVTGSTMNPHRRWMLALPVRGSLVLDQGACKAVAGKNSLLAAGVLEVSGNFHRDECVSLVDKATGAEIARALMNLDSMEVCKIMGVKSSEYARILGFSADPEIAYRANMILVAQNETRKV